MCKSLIKLLVLCVICTCTTASSQDVADMKTWSDKNLLTYDDFTGQPDVKSKEAFKCDVRIEVKGSHLEDGIAKYDVSCYLVKNHSWIVVCDDMTLASAQLQFDIGELYARKTRRKFDEMIKSNIIEAGNFQQVLEQFGSDKDKRIKDFMKIIQDNQKAKKKLKKQIQTELLELEAYK